MASRGELGEAIALRMKCAPIVLMLLRELRSRGELRRVEES